MAASVSSRSRVSQKSSRDYRRAIRFVTRNKCCRTSVPAWGELRLSYVYILYASFSFLTSASSRDIVRTVYRACFSLNECYARVSSTCDVRTLVWTIQMKERDRECENKREWKTERKREREWESERTSEWVSETWCNHEKMQLCLKIRK